MIKINKIIYKSCMQILIQKVDYSFFSLIICTYFSKHIIYIQIYYLRMFKYIWKKISIYKDWLYMKNEYIYKYLYIYVYKYIYIYK